MTNDGIRHEKDIKVIGLIPAGGTASRLSPIPCSKEIYPIGFDHLTKDGNPHPKVVCHYLLERLQLACISTVYIILRSGKWDIPSYLGSGKMLNMDLAYLMMDLPFGVPYTLDQAYPFVKDSIVALGFPDILFVPNDAFVQILVRQSETRADLVLAVVPTNRPEKWDMLDLDELGRIRRFVIKPTQTHLYYTWIVAVWTPVFTNFMHQYLITHHREIRGQDAGQNLKTQKRELYMGDVFQLAIEEGLSIETVVFPKGSCIDIGTPEDLLKVPHFLKSLSL